MAAVAWEEAAMAGVAPAVVAMGQGIGVAEGLRGMVVAALVEAEQVTAPMEAATVAVAGLATVGSPG